MTQKNPVLCLLIVGLINSCLCIHLSVCYNLKSSFNIVFLYTLFFKFIGNLPFKPLLLLNWDCSGSFGAAYIVYRNLVVIQYQYSMEP